MSALTKLLDAGGWRLRIMMFHGVGVPDYPALTFAKQLESLTRRYEVVSIDRALQTLHSDCPPRRPLMVLTFDDGLRNNYRVAYPLLCRLGLPAVFYVCPALIDVATWLWNHEARERLHSLVPAERNALAENLGSPSSDSNSIVEWMKTLPIDECHARLDVVRSATKGFVPSRLQRDCFDLMSWQELSDLDPGLITVGSHTLSHPILTRLSSEQLDHEVRKSRQWLEDRLQRNVSHFCYPNGTNSPAVRAAVTGAYDSAVTTHYGYVRPGDDAHLLRRIAATPKRANLVWRLHRRYPAAR